MIGTGSAELRIYKLGVVIYPFLSPGSEWRLHRFVRADKFGWLRS
jgi:hypothetical protein